MIERRRQLVEHLPPFRSVANRRRALRAARAARRLRRVGAELAGSARYSHPELPGLLAHLDFDGGFFVEAGANDGFRQSNTYYLERFRGWEGVLIEPIPELHTRCARERPRARCLNCALVAPDAAGGEVVLRYDDLGSHLTSSEAGPGDPGDACWGWDRGYDVSVPARTLTDVLHETLASSSRRLDFLSLDLEGHEEAALQGLDLESFAPAHLLVEVLQPERRLPGLLNLLDVHYEFVAWVTPTDLLLRSCR